MSCFILLEFSILYFVSQALRIALIYIAGLFFYSVGGYYLSYFLCYVGTKNWGKPIESRVNQFSEMGRYVPHTWATYTDNGEQR